jgi:hypothetical protein
MALVQKNTSKFDGADDLYLTPKRIVKVSVVTKAKRNAANEVVGMAKKETRSLYAKTQANLIAAKEVNGGPLRYVAPKAKAAPKPKKQAKPAKKTVTAAKPKPSIKKKTTGAKVAKKGK